MVEIEFETATMGNFVMGWRVDNLGLGGQGQGQDSDSCRAGRNSIHVELPLDGIGKGSSLAGPERVLHEILPLARGLSVGWVGKSTLSVLIKDEKLCTL